MVEDHEKNGDEARRTILQALAIAGGFQDYANRKNITILRG